jgi:hypothetical protein
MMKETLVKMASVANALDEAGYYEDADTITEIMKTAKKKIDTNYSSGIVDRLYDSFNSTARRLEGPTARRELRDAGIEPRKLARHLDELNEKMDQIRGMLMGS